MADTVFHSILTYENKEDPEVGGFFAWFADADTTDPGWGRGHGFSRLEAIFNLILLKAEQDEVNLNAQAPDLISSGAIHNVAIEDALERRYGGRIEYNPS